jgi:hypothetical protein
MIGLVLMAAGLMVATVGVGGLVAVRADAPCLATQEAVKGAVLLVGLGVVFLVMGGVQ